ncbi:baseplate J/gp47 family protein [Dictyobacter formicarum]|nr:baseplate J/gp47 family protein [Dictyobacter formicarum]
MSDEQTIYISPDDDLTTVRERLEKLQTRKVTLVVPAQTQLRSHVAWKLLYARARELGKDVLIVSSDPQVRSVAHAVKFTVAHSLESSQQGRSRPTGRPARSGTTNRARPANPSQRPTGARTARSTNTLRPRQAGARNSSNLANRDNRENARDQLRQQPLQPPVDDPATFQFPDESYEDAYDYGSHHTTPPIRPLAPDQIEEPDLLLEDYALTQDIRQAAGKSNSEPGLGAPGTRTSTEVEPQAPRTHTPYRSLDADEDDDPFLLMEDKQPPPSVEQRGEAVIESPDHHYDHIIQDVAEAPTSIIGNHFNIDEDGDEIVAPRPRGAQNRERQATRKETRPRERPRQDAEPTRQRRSGKMVPPPPPAAFKVSHAPSQRLRAEDLDDDDLLPIQDRPTQVKERGTFTYEPPSRTSHKNPDLIPLPEERPRTYGARSGQMQRPAAADQRQARPSGVLTSSRRPPAGRPSKGLRSRKSQTLAKPRQKRRNTLVWIIAAAIICLFLALALGAYFLPTATVTITIAARNYSHPVSTLAALEPTQGSIPAHQLVHEFTKTSPEPVTGTKLVGTAKAKGNVCFSNNGDTDIIIPTGSEVSTPGVNGVLFKTTAEVSIPKQTLCSNVPLPVPVEAVKAGESGNVPAGSVTLIPDTSLDSIAKTNNTTAAQLKLSVTSIDDIKGGGMEPVAAIADKDLTNARNDLHKQLQGQIDTWIKSLPQNGAIGPLTTTDTLINPPAKDTVIESGKTFPAQISVKATVLFVNNSDLQNAARTQLSSAMKKDKAFSQDVILNDARQPISISKLKQQPAGKTGLKLDYVATAPVGGAFDANILRQQIAGQRPDSASHLLKSNNKGIQDTHIDIQPGFFPYLPFYSNHIDIKVVPGMVPAKA